MYKQRVRRWIAKCTFVAAGALVAACTETVTPDPPALTTISVTTSAPTVPVGQSISATATGADQNGSAIPTGTVVWTSSSGVSIDATGKITGISAGPATVTATASGVTGQATITVSPLPAAGLKLVTPPSATSPSRARFAQQPVIQLVNSAGGDVALAGVTVTVVSTGGGVLTAASATTDATGKATFTDLSLGGLAANYTLKFGSAPLTGVTANVVLTAGAASLVQMVGGNQQQAQAGSAVPAPLTVKVVDSDGNPVAGATVVFDVASGGGTVTGSPAVTGASGIASPAAWTLGSTGANSLLAHLTGNPFGVTFTATATQPPPVLTSLVVTLSPATVAAGSQSQASVSGVDQYGAAISTGTVVWSTSGPATVSPTGVVSAVAAGQAAIIATAGGKTAQATLTITAQPVLTTLTVTVASSTITVGTTTQATVSGKDQFGAAIAVGSVTWTAIGNASVNSSGLVTGTNPGAAAVRATAGGLTAQADFVVQAVAPATPVLTTLFVQLMPATTPVGGSSQATVTGADQFGFPIATGPIVWSATGGAAISQSGAISAQSAGTASITATAGSVSGSAPLTITPSAQPPVLTSLVISVAPATIAIGGTSQATAVGKDQFGATIQTGTIVWGATGTVSVSSTGLVTGVSAGTGILTATVGAVSSQAAVTVTGPGQGPALAAIYVTVSPTTIAVGGQAQATAEGRDISGNVIPLGPVTWTGTAGVTISGTGLITGVSVGQHTVTATVGNKSGNGGITVSTAPYLYDLRISINPTSITVGGQAQATVTGLDQYGNPFPAGQVAWYASAGASITNQGLIVGTAPGVVTISATKGSVSTQTTMTVTGSANLRLSVNSPPANIPNRNTFSTQPSVQLVDANTGQPVAQAGVVVTASLTRGLGTLIGTTSVATNAAGKAVWTDLGVAAERVNGAIITFSAPGSLAATWTFNILGGSVPTSIVKLRGDNQTNVVGWLVQDDLEIAVVDPEGNPVSVVVPVNFSVTAGGGSISGASTVTANGSASVNLWRLGAVGTNSVTVTVPGVNTPVIFNATATPTLPCAAPGTLTIGQQTFGKLQHTGCVFHAGPGNGSFTGPRVDAYDDYDAYYIDVPAGAAVRFDVGYDFGTFKWPLLSLYDPAGTFIGSRRADSATPLSLVNPTPSTVRYTFIISYRTGQYTGGFYNISPVRTN